MERAQKRTCVSDVVDCRMMILDMLKYDTEDKCTAEQRNKISPGMAPRPWANSASWHRQIEANVIISRATFLESMEVAIPDCSRGSTLAAGPQYKLLSLPTEWIDPRSLFALESIAVRTLEQEEPSSPALPHGVSSTNIQYLPTRTSVDAPLASSN